MRDELSHNVFLMLLECNKFREHQARELLIELLEQQLEERKKLLVELQTNITKADELLAGNKDTKPAKKEDSEISIKAEETATASIKQEAMEE
jgi:MED7 protein